ncbi:hypothetical protein HDV00_001218 [Rhizophlyctis rosea]|nr:hypothetical protein HDV00_001218 [Rhizophlyctis rosea]
MSSTWTTVSPRTTGASPVGGHPVLFVRAPSGAEPKRLKPHTFQGHAITLPPKRPRASDSTSPSPPKRLKPTASTFSQKATSSRPSIRLAPTTRSPNADVLWAEDVSLSSAGSSSDEDLRPIPREGTHWNSLPVPQPVLIPTYLPDGWWICVSCAHKNYDILSCFRCGVEKGGRSAGGASVDCIASNGAIEWVGSDDDQGSSNAGGAKSGGSNKSIAPKSGGNGSPARSKSIPSVKPAASHPSTHKRTSHRCPTCNERCATKAGLLSHLRKHESQARPSTPTCQICRRTFDNETELRTHAETHQARSSPSIKVAASAPAPSSSTPSRPTSASVSSPSHLKTPGRTSALRQTSLLGFLKSPDGTSSSSGGSAKRDMGHDGKTVGSSQRGRKVKEEAERTSVSKPLATDDRVVRREVIDLTIESPKPLHRSSPRVDLAAPSTSSSPQIPARKSGSSTSKRPIAVKGDFGIGDMIQPEEDTRSPLAQLAEFESLERDLFGSEVREGMSPRSRGGSGSRLQSKDWSSPTGAASNRPDSAKGGDEEGNTMMGEETSRGRTRRGGFDFTKHRGPDRERGVGGSPSDDEKMASGSSPSTVTTVIRKEAVQEITTVETSTEESWEKRVFRNTSARRKEVVETWKGLAVIGKRNHGFGGGGAGRTKMGAKKESGRMRRGESASASPSRVRKSPVSGRGGRQNEAVATRALRKGKESGNWQVRARTQQVAEMDADDEEGSTSEEEIDPLFAHFEDHWQRRRLNTALPPGLNPSLAISSFLDGFPMHVDSLPLLEQPQSSTGLFQAAKKTYYATNLMPYLTSGSHLSDLKEGKGLDESACEEIKKGGGGVVETAGKGIGVLGPKRPMVRVVESLEMRGGGRGAAVMDTLHARFTHRFQNVYTYKRASGHTTSLAFSSTSTSLLLASSHVSDSSTAYTHSGNVTLCDLAGQGWSDAKKGVVRNLHEKKSQSNEEGEQELIEDEDVGAHWFWQGDSRINSNVTDVVFSPCDTYLFTCSSRDAEVRMWNLRDGGSKVDLKRHGGGKKLGLNRVGVCEGRGVGKCFVAGAAIDGSVPFWKVWWDEEEEEDGEWLWEPFVMKVGYGKSNQHRVATDLVFSSGPSGGGGGNAKLFVGFERKFGGMEDGKVRQYDLETETQTQEWSMDENAVACLAMSPRGQYIAAGATGNGSHTGLPDVDDEAMGDGFFRVFDLRQKGSVMKFLTGQTDCNVVGFSPCERFLYACGDPLKNGQVPPVVVFDSRWCKSMVPSSSSSSSSAGILHRLEHKPTTAAPHRDGVTSGHWMKRSGLLVTGGHDCCVRIWDVRRGDPLVKVLEGHEAPVSAMRVSEDERWIGVGTTTGQISVWSVEDGVAEVLERVGEG